MTSKDKGAKREKTDERPVPPGFESLTSFTPKRTERKVESGNLAGVQGDIEQKTTSKGREAKKEKTDERPVPPGFESLIPFTLKRTERNGEAGDIEPEPVESSSKMDDVEKLRKSLKQRPWILYDQLINLEKLDRTPLNTNISLENSLPKGVIRGCSNCTDCQNVTARWCPEDSCRPVMDYAPVFHPTEEEFEDTLKYIAKIRPKAEGYGICRIVPRASWQPPCLIKGKRAWEACRFPTHVQQIDELKNLHSKRKLNKIIEEVKGNGRSSLTELDCESDGFEFECGLEFTLRTFKKYADYFKRRYFEKKDIFADFRTPLWENEEGEYWRIVQNPTEQIQVLSAHNLEAKVLGSGFPSPSLNDDDDRTEYTESGWNLNNTPKLSGSLLAFDYDGSSASTPRVDVGMCFSSLCWKVEEHHLYSLSYLHLGAPRIWYGVPGKYHLKYEALLKKTFPELSGHPELFHKLVTQIPPPILKSEGIPVYRCVQHPKQFVLIFPGSYHSAFDTGFNVSESVNLAPLDWLPYGQLTAETYSEQQRKTLISYDKLLIEAAKDAVKESKTFRMPRDSKQWKNACGKNGWLTRALKSRVRHEASKRDFLANASQSRKMKDEFGSSIKRECIVCFNDLYLSAAGCTCSPDRYCCLEHSKQICTCPWSSKFFLFRYDIDELNLLIDALEGNVKAL